MDELIFHKQMHYLSMLKINIASMNKALKLLEDKIENEGINGYYSCNHDALRYAQQIWKASHALGELRAFKEEIGVEEE